MADNTQKIAEILGDKNTEQNRLSQQFVGTTGEVVDRFEFYKDKVHVGDSGLRAYTQDATGSGLIWGNADLGIWGTHNWNTEGSSFTAWTEITISGLTI